MTAMTKAQGLELIEQENFDLVLLDVTLPDGSGYEICKRMREDSRLKEIPVIFLTACDDEVNIVMGLDLGADDYITKPFRVRELISRMNSVLRRSGKKQAETTINYQNLSINTIAARVFKNNQEIFLTGMEYRLLLILATHRNQVMTRDQLFEAIWDLGGEYVNDNTLTVYIKRLREKLEEDPTHPQLIRTIRGLGYKMGE
ncbi:MAG: response regulator transcription factor [Holdemania massiliensis]